MISLAKVLSGKPIEVTKGVLFYQPTIQEITDMGEAAYWSIVNLWMLDRKDIVAQETETTIQHDDYTMWKAYIFTNPILRQSLATSCYVLLKSEITL